MSPADTPEARARETLPCAHGEERAETVAHYHSDWVCVKCGRRRSACGHDDKARAALAATPAPDSGAEERLRAAALTVLEALRPRLLGHGMKQIPTLRYDSPSIVALRSVLSGGSVDEE